MSRIKNIINKYSTGKRVLILFILTNIVYATMLTITIPKTMAFSGGMELLDMMPTGYGSAYIISLFSALGENGRHTYLYTQLPVDMIYPLLFGINYCLMIGYFLKKLNKLDSLLFYLCFLPVIAGTADYLENIGIITMLINYPNLSQSLMSATNAFSIIKSMTTTVFFMALLLILVIFGIKTLKERRMNNM